MAVSVLWTVVEQIEIAKIVSQDIPPALSALYIWYPLVFVLRTVDCSMTSNSVTYNSCESTPRT